MMSEKTLENPEIKSCESCGKEFHCGASSEKCWCFEIDLSQDTLAELRENFKSCLCKSCLQQKSLTVNKVKAINNP